jgi:hypothetical protein
MTVPVSSTTVIPWQIMDEVFVVIEGSCGACNDVQIGVAQGFGLVSCRYATKGSRIE